MTLAKLNIPGSLVSDRPNYAAGPAWVDGDMIRFQQGLPEAIGGWISETAWSFTGQPNKVIAWTTLSGNNCLAVGSEKKLELIFDDTKYDITPLRATASLTNPFDTANTDKTVTVNDTAHGAETGDIIVVSGASAGGGITVEGDYEVATIVDSDEYTIEHSSAASSTASATGGSLTIKYLLGTGSTDGSGGLGWGAGLWDEEREGSPVVAKTISGITRANPGVATVTAHGFSNGDLVKIVDVAGMVQVNGNYYIVTDKNTDDFELGTTDTSGFTSYSSAGKARLQLGWGSPASEDTAGVDLEPNLWSFDLWGEDLQATRRGGGTYQWDASAGTGTRAALISNAPSTGLFLQVSLPDRHLILFGAHDGSNSDPLLVRWSDQEDNTVWTASATNTAGSQRLDRGSKLMAALQIRDQTLIWTDDSIFSMSFQGPPFTFSFRHMASGCGPIAQNAVVESQGVALWIGCNYFYYYDGSVKILPSPVRDKLFDNISTEGTNVTFTGKNDSFSEVWFFYATEENTSPDSYIAVNFTDKAWTFGSLSRTAWIDQISWLTSPVALNSSGTAYYHEVGYSDDGSDITAYVTSGAFEIGESNVGGAGEHVLLINKFIPDGTLGNASVDLNIYVAPYPLATEVTKGPYTITSSTGKISLRAKGRQMRFEYTSTGQEYWQMGIPRINYRLDGNPGA
jgi:hypothetical protein